MPEMWLTPVARAMESHQEDDDFVIVGFVTGARADKVAALPAREVARLMALQLDMIFGSIADPHPATESMVDFHIQSWKDQEFIYGAYSSPSIGAQRGTRELLGLPVMDTVFFAGEATSVAVNPCMNGAIDTGMKAANAVLRSLQSRANITASRL